MTPTNKLRFVERWVIDHVNSSHEHIAQRPIRVLQQFWEHKNVCLSVLREDADGNTVPPPVAGEWRDVPLERET